METLELCEEMGINTAILRLDDHCKRILNRYWNERGGKIQWIAQIKIEPDDLSSIQDAVDHGAIGAYVHGGNCDTYVEKGQVDLLGKAVDMIKKNKVIAGLAGHTVEVPIACEKAGLPRLLVGRGPARERQHLVPDAGEDHRVHEHRQEALDRVQGHGGRRHHAQPGVQVRLRKRCRFHLRRHVRFPGPRGRHHRQQNSRRQAKPQTPLARLGRRSLSS